MLILQEDEDKLRTCYTCGKFYFCFGCGLPKGLKEHNVVSTLEEVLQLFRLRKGEARRYKKICVQNCMV